MTQFEKARKTNKSYDSNRISILSSFQCFQKQNEREHVRFCLKAVDNQEIALENKEIGTHNKVCPCKTKIRELVSSYKSFLDEIDSLADLKHVVWTMTTLLGQSGWLDGKEIIDLYMFSELNIAK
jgi:hypothetical protein